MYTKTRLIRGTLTGVFVAVTCIPLEPVPAWTPPGCCLGVTQNQTKSSAINDLGVRCLINHIGGSSISYYDTTKTFSCVFCYSWHNQSLGRLPQPDHSGVYKPLNATPTNTVTDTQNGSARPESYPIPLARTPSTDQISTASPVIGAMLDGWASSK